MAVPFVVSGHEGCMRQNAFFSHRLSRSGGILCRLTLVGPLVKRVSKTMDDPGKEFLLYRCAVVTMVVDDLCFFPLFKKKSCPGTPKVFLGSRSPKSAVPYVTTEAQKEICLVVEEISLSGCFHPSLALPLIDTLLWSTELCEVSFTQWQPYRENCRLETVLRYSYIW